MSDLQKKYVTTCERDEFHDRVPLLRLFCVTKSWLMYTHLVSPANHSVEQHSW